ncbi:MAG: hypothetical protein ACUVWO_15770 [Thermodesulfobacteriota bacterium]
MDARDYGMIGQAAILDGQGLKQEALANACNTHLLQTIMHVSDSSMIPEAKTKTKRC